VKHKTSLFSYKISFIPSKYPAYIQVKDLILYGRTFFNKIECIGEISILRRQVYGRNEK